MITCLTIGYIVLVALVFKVFKVKPRPVPIALMASLGVILLGGIVVLWKLAAPLSKRVIVTRYVVQIVPWVKGQVRSIPAKPNVPLKKGAVLYEIDPAPYQYTVSQLDAQLKAAKSNVTQLEASVQVAIAAVERTQAGVKLDKSALDVAVAIEKLNPAAIAQLKLVEAQQKYAASLAELSQAKATVDQARAAVATAKDNVVAVHAQLETAQFDLTECTMSAPSDGFVTDWQIRPGTWVAPATMSAAGTFIDTSETGIVASFPAEQLIYVKPGQPVELTFKSAPGRLFLGHVENVIQATGEGQFAPGGKLPSAASIGSPGFLAVLIRLNDGQHASELEMGTPGAVAIYTDWGKPLDMISKVTLRMQKWMYFLPLPS
jgi:membrane fusion protein (multidrug efflux system)